LRAQRKKIENYRADKPFPVPPQATIFNSPFSICARRHNGAALTPSSQGGVPPAGGGRIAMRATYQFLLFLTVCSTPYVFPKFQ